MAGKVPFTVEFYKNVQAAETTRFQCSLLELIDIETINTEIRAKLIRAAKASIGPEDSEQLRTAIIDSAMRQALQVSFFSQSGRQYFATLDGAALMLYTSLKKCEKVTIDDVVEIVKDPRNGSECEFALVGITGLEGMSKSPPKNSPDSQRETTPPVNLAGPGNQNSGRKNKNKKRRSRHHN